MAFSWLLAAQILILLGIRQAHAQSAFGFTNVHGSNMVLQRAPNRAQIYGTAPDVTDTVKVTIYDAQDNALETVSSAVTENNTWLVQLSPRDASMNGEQYKIVAQSSNNASAVTQIENVLFGDIYICSGQSNMQFTVDQAFNLSESLAEANNYPNLRMLSVAQDFSNTPRYQVIALKQEWSVASNVTVAGGNWSYFSAMCWFFGKNLYDELQIPLGLIGTNYGGTPIRDWMSADAKLNCPNETISTSADNKHDDITRHGKNYNFEPLPVSVLSSDTDGAAPNGGLWNAMICPFLPMTIKGAIWYQGESDCDYPYYASYSCAFPAMIADWRGKWKQFSDTNGDFPFGFVHLSTWDDMHNTTCNANTTCEFVAVVRDAQTANFGYAPNPKMPNTYLASAIDLGDATSPFGDIHPRYKQQVARRLADGALKYIYGESTRYVSGPIADSVSVNAGSIEINFRNVNEMGLTLNSLIGFEVYDESVLKWIYITPNEQNVQLNGLWNVTVSYTADSVAKPTQIRYNFYQAPCMPAAGIYGCAVYDKQAMLPSLPFLFSLA